MAKRFPKELVTEVVCEWYDITQHQIKGPKRPYSYVIPRWVLYKLLRDICGMSTPEIGMHVGGRDHTTILHGLAALSERTERLDDNVLLADIKDIVDIIYERAEDYAPSPEIKLNPELQEALSALDVFRESLIKAFK